MATTSDLIFSPQQTTFPSGNLSFQQFRYFCYSCSMWLLSCEQASQVTGKNKQTNSIFFFTASVNSNYKGQKEEEYTQTNQIFLLLKNLEAIPCHIFPPVQSQQLCQIICLIWRNVKTYMQYTRIVGNTVLVRNNRLTQGTNILFRSTSANNARYSLPPRLSFPLERKEQHSIVARVQ